MFMKNYPKEAARYDTSADPAASKGEILDRIAKAAYDNDREYKGCTHSVLDALQIHLHPTDDCKAYRAVLKASTALAAGVARRRDLWCFDRGHNGCSLGQRC
jgi:hypothetical protein